MATTFYLGTHEPAWLYRAGVPLFVSARRLRRQQAWGRAAAPWALDSGGFSELSMYGQWRTDPMTYSSEVRKWSSQIGGMAFAAIQDWMCEPHIVAKTRLSVRGHQAMTIHSWHLLRRLAPDLPWLPVLQGWDVKDYLDHIDQYRTGGTVLADQPLVGVGSICRRQGTEVAEELFRELHRRGLRCHAFGLKQQGLLRCSKWLASADSMAWSLAARRREPLPECTHAKCNNCLRYAMRWRGQMLSAMESGLKKRHDQLRIWDMPS